MSNVETYSEKTPVADLSAVESPHQAGVLQPTTFAANGNVIDGGLQRGLKSRHLVSLFLDTKVRVVIIM